MYRCTILAVLTCVAVAQSAPAMIINGSTGAVTDWGVTPFSQAGPGEGVDGNMAFALSNDYSPISYPWGIGHVPSPGGSDGEKIDLEEMYLRTVGGRMEVLLVCSTGLSAVFSGQTYYLGDLMLTIDGRRYGVVTQYASQHLAPGSIWRIDAAGDTAGLQSGSRSYAGVSILCENDYGAPATVAQIAGPWAVKGSIDDDQLLGAAVITTGTYNYGGKETGTFLIEYSFDLSDLGSTPPTSVQAQITWGCGNDVIRVRETLIPEPATMALLGLGLGGFIVRRKRH